jgi:hypothetical protein
MYTVTESSDITDEIHDRMNQRVNETDSDYVKLCVTIEALVQALDHLGNSIMNIRDERM